MAALHLYHLSGLSTDTKPILEDALTGSTFEELDTQNIYVYSQNSKSWILSKNHKPKPEEEKPLVGPQTCIGIKKIEKTSTEGLVDTYTIEYTNGTNQQFTIVNSPKVVAINQKLEADPLQDNKLYNIEISVSSDNPDETELFDVYQPLVLSADETEGIITSDYLASDHYWPRTSESKFVIHLTESNTDILFVYLGKSDDNIDYWHGYKLREDSVLIPYIGNFIDNHNGKYYFIAAEQPVVDVEDLKRQIREEIARATHAEETLQENLDNETERAQSAEELLQANIEAEEARAIEAETTLQENLDTEAERAIASETILDERIAQEILDRTADVNAEEQRALNAEAILQENLDLETERAIVAENVLDGKLDDEIARATNKENALNTRIDNLDLAQVGQDGSYIKFVSQENGQLSATTQTFDTTIPNSNPSTINAPTTSAVKIYVDNADTNIQNQLNAHKTDRNNPHEVTTEQIQAVSYGRPQSLNSDQKRQAKTNISLELVENYPQALGTEYKAAESATSKKYFPLKGAYNLFNELYDDASDIQNEIDQIGEVVGYQRQMEIIPGNSGEEDQYSYVGDIFNYTYELDPNGFVQQTKDLADRNEARLANIAKGLAVNAGDVNIVNDLTVGGDLVVKGTTTTSDQQTIQSESTIIVTNSTNAPLTDYSGTVALKGNFEIHEVTAQNYHPNYFWYIDDSETSQDKRIIVIDGHKYVLDDSPNYTVGRQYYSQTAEAVGLYDTNEDAVVIGEGNYYGGHFEFDVKYSIISLNEHTYIPNKYYILNQGQYILATGDFDPAETYYLKLAQGQHLATRADSTSLIDEHLLAWDAAAYTLVDSGKSIAILENEHSQEVAARQNADNAIWTEIGQKTDKAGTETVYGYIDYERGERDKGDTRLRNDLVLALNSTEARLQENLDDETERAIVAEAVLDDRIDQLAGGTEQSLADEIERATQAEATLQDHIDDESERAIVAESVLDGKIDDEINRATGVENTIIDNIGEITDQWEESGNNTVYAYINKERDRATNVETAIQNTIGTTVDPASTNTVYGHIKAEEERATQVEGNLANDINTVNVTAVKDVVYENNTNNVKAIRKTINNVTSDVVDINILKSDMALNNVTNDRQVVGLAPATDPETHEPINYNNHILLFDTDGYHIKDSGWTLDDTGKIDTISIDGTNIPAVNKNVNLPAYPTQFLITANATDGLFDITASGNYNSVTYSFAPYSTKQQSSSFYSGSVNPTLTDRLNYDGYLYATKLYSNGSETITESNISTITNAQIDNLFTEPYIADGDNEQF